MGAATALFVNDYDTSRLGFILRRVTGKDAALSAKDKITQLPKRVGEVPLAREAETASRLLSITGTIGDRSWSVTTVLASIRELKQRLYSGTIEVRFNDDPEKLFFARAEEGDFACTDPQFASPWADVTITLRCHDPLIYARLGTVIGFKATAGQVPLGTAISLPTIRIAGAVTNPVVTYRDFRGASKQTMGFTATLLASEYLEADCELMQIRRVTAGVPANGDPLLTSGDFLRLDPDDGDLVGGAWPTLEVSPAASGEALYRKAWI